MKMKCTEERVLKTKRLIEKNKGGVEMKKLKQKSIIDVWHLGNLFSYQGHSMIFNKLKNLKAQAQSISNYDKITRTTIKILKQKIVRKAG